MRNGTKLVAVRTFGEGSLFPPAMAGCFSSLHASSRFIGFVHELDTQNATQCNAKLVANFFFILFACYICGAFCIVASSSSD